ncbi:cell wall metabolism sensor histidine kinase WalK [Cellulomonas sp. SLBN-39]|uniref:sensor histidine kinase n=1 Tax=Cellulomonas sp. SLBN-39 TaxID=2768446 RepID=UPI00114F045A|nr:HAMP domain-containing sensor histidine kinase [Cellulomonas sp. SLBN-39]TQL02246.1 two-component system OmpR family sensor kinase [Cellulomonas sp. SLBN-39]
MGSIRRRLTVGMVAAMAVVVLAFAGATTLIVSHVLADRSRDNLAATAERTRGALAAVDGITLDDDDLRGLVGGQTGLRGVVVVGSGGTVLASSQVDPADADVLAAVDATEPAPAAGHYLAVGIPTADLDLALERDGTATQVVHVVLTVDTTEQEAVVDAFVTLVAVGAVVSIAVVVASAVVIVGRGLQPLRTMADRADAVAAGDRTRRLPVQDRDDPAIARLARTVNAAFDAQQDAEHRVRAFVADASHELRSPLTAATGWVDLDLQGALDDPARREHAMQRVAAQLARMGTLVDELATLARTDAGTPLAAEPVDLGALAAEVVEDARVVDPDRRIRLVAAPAPVLGDPTRLAQVLRNLVANATTHTPPDAAVTVTVTPGALRHQVTVADTGPGIPLAHLPHLFERFWRADPARGPGGSGLGLAIVQSLVEAHGGTVAVTSTPGTGTTVTLTLPTHTP